MRTLLIHLSDIHITDQQDKIFGLVPGISHAAVSLDPPVNRAIVLATGDIANTGCDEEYTAATEFFSRLHAELVKEIQCESSRVLILPVPGNHDCDFRGSQAVREIVLSSLTGAEALRSPDVLEVLSKPQAPFRQFLNVLRQKQLCPPPSTETALRSTYAIGTPPNQIVVHAYNTAICSRKDEAAILQFPAEEVSAEEPEKYTLVISAFHHPYYWLQPVVSRQFRAAIERSSDLVLTGHEHVAERRHAHLATGECLTYVEGAVLQERGQPGASGFNAFLLDGTNRQYLPAEFSYDRKQKLYAMALVDGTTAPAWDDFPLNRQRTRALFPFSVEHERYLDDPGIQLTHGLAGDLQLADIFVCPDIQEVVPASKRHPKTIAGESVFEFLNSAERVLLVGDEGAGKTTLAKALCRFFHAKGDLPLLIQAKSSLCRGAGLRNCVREAIARQYNHNLVTAFEQADRKKRVLILDDFDRLAGTPERRHDTLLAIEPYFGRVVLIANEISLTLRDLLTQYSERYPQYRMQGFGYLHRNDLVDKWLAKYPAKDAAEVARRAVAFSRTLDQVFGRGGVPPYPVYILAVLQASDASLQVTPSVSTHGYYYELLIKAELVRGVSNRETDVLLAYMAFLAYRFFAKNIDEVSLEQYRQLHQEYQSSYAIDIDCQAMLKTLCERKMLELRNDTVRFRYKYILQYFVAHYLSDHLADDDAKRAVQTMINRVHRRECAETLLFLAHQTRDGFLIDILTKEAAKHYAGIDGLRRLVDVSISGDMEELADRVAYEDRDVRETRREIAASKDRSTGAELAQREDEWIEMFEPLRNLMAGLHTMQIIGQVLKTFPGRLGSQNKLRLATSAYGIGMRAWRAIFNDLSTNRETIARELTDAVLREDPSASRSALSTRAQNLIRSLSFLCGWGMVKRVADALGAAEMSQTYADVLASEENSEIARLVHVAIKFDHQPTIPESDVKQLYAAVKDSPLGKWIVQQMTLNHFELFFVDQATKQRLCSALLIEYRPPLGAGTRSKRLRKKN